MLKTLVGTGFLAAPMINRGRYSVFADSTVEYSKRAVELMQRATVMDMLGPLTLDFPKQAKWFANPGSFTAADLQPYKDSGISIFHIAVEMCGPGAYLNVLKYFASW